MTNKKPLVVGFSAGMEAGNSEVLLKEALMSAEDAADVEVQHIRMHDLDIPIAFRDGNSVFPDEYEVHGDAAWFLDRILEADALIISAPLYIRSMPGQLKVISDRIFGPNAAAGFQWFIQSRIDAGDPAFEGAVVDQRFFKPKVGGFITVGGAITHEWGGPLGLSEMNMFTFPMRFRIVDQIHVRGAGLPRAVVVDDDAMGLSGQLGRNVVSQIGRSFEEAEFKGKNSGTCPLCHLDLIVAKGGAEIECATCGLVGEIKIEDGKPVFAFPHDVSKYDEDSIFGIEGTITHVREIMGVAEALQSQVDEIDKRSRKYESYDRLVKPSDTDTVKDAKAHGDLGLART